MTKKEKAEEICSLGGLCACLFCGNTISLDTDCPCFSYCLYNGVLRQANVNDTVRMGRVECCNSFLEGENMNKQVFDKSKVLVAGLHEIEEGKKYIVADTVRGLERKVIGEEVHTPRTLVVTSEIFESANGNLWRFAYPYEELKKTWRPIRTIEEAEQFLGKKIKNKDGKMLSMIINIYLENTNGAIDLNQMSTQYVFDNYTTEDGSPVGIEE